MRPIAGLVFFAGVSAASIQQPLSTPSSGEASTGEHYRFDWPIRRVAIIGAGPSGLAAYRELTEAGLQARMFERDSVPGGDWHYTEEIPLDAPVPNTPASIGAFTPSLPPTSINLPYSQELEDDSQVRRDHRGPKAVWESLTADTPWHVLPLPGWTWPSSTRWEVSHYQIRNYVRSYASYLNINSNDENPAVAYNTRVERIEKRINEAGQEQGWRLWLKSLEPTRRNTYRATWWTEDFDAVVVAAGMHNAPFMPTIPGLEEWVRKFPDFVRHSRQYRRPDVYANQTVLIVGASASGTGISIDLNCHARNIYQSFRPHNYNRKYSMLESQLRRIPKNTTLVGEITRFSPITEGSSIQSGYVELKNGTILTGIDRVILATGSRHSFPFLPQYYDGAVYEPHSGSATTVSPFLPLDGTYIRDLYLDQFYTRDPTLAFLGVLAGSSSFLTAEYTTLALAKVWTNMAELPNTEGMQAWCEKTVVERGGYSKYFLFVTPDQFIARITYWVGWLNSAAARYGGKQVDAFPKHLGEVFYYWHIAFFGTPIQLGLDGDENVLASPGINPGNDAGLSP